MVGDGTQRHMECPVDEKVAKATVKYTFTPKLGDESDNAFIFQKKVRIPVASQPTLE